MLYFWPVDLDPSLAVTQLPLEAEVYKGAILYAYYSGKAYYYCKMCGGWIHGQPTVATIPGGFARVCARCGLELEQWRPDDA